VTDAEWAWGWRDARIRIGLTRGGDGPTLLLLPALSSISTRAEMRPLQERLARSFATVAVDWPGFGPLPRPPVAWAPEAHAAFLGDVATELAPAPRVTIAAGHACGHVLGQAARRPGSLGALVLIAPTWRGPLPTMLGRRHPAFPRIARAVDRPLLGPLLYQLNVNRVVARMMARGHVYTDPAWLDGPRAAGKWAVIAAPGARHASIRFVAGELDPVRSREEWLALAARVSDPMLVVFGAGTPRKSMAEMEALAAVPRAQAVRLPVGKLGVHEEYPDDVLAAIAPFVAAPR
jgi:pimeloyl-ACP methyl ester carboxylesterase